MEPVNALTWQRFSTLDSEVLGGASTLISAEVLKEVGGFRCVSGACESSDGVGSEGVEWSFIDLCERLRATGRDPRLLSVGKSVVIEHRHLGECVMVWFVSR